MCGWYSLLIASTMCKKIDMYGFEPWEDWMAEGQSDLHYHYFEAEEPRPGAHSFDATFFMYKMVEMSNKFGLSIRSVELPEELAKLKSKNTRESARRKSGSNTNEADSKGDDLDEE